MFTQKSLKLLTKRNLSYNTKIVALPITRTTQCNCVLFRRVVLLLNFHFMFIFSTLQYRIFLDRRRCCCNLSYQLNFRRFVSYHLIFSAQFLAISQICRSQISTVGQKSRFFNGRFKFRRILSYQFPQFIYLFFPQFIFSTTENNQKNLQDYNYK